VLDKTSNNIEKTQVNEETIRKITCELRVRFILVWF